MQQPHTNCKQENERGVYQPGTAPITSQMAPMKARLPRAGGQSLFYWCGTGERNAWCSSLERHPTRLRKRCTYEATMNIANANTPSEENEQPDYIIRVKLYYWGNEVKHPVLS